MDKIKKVIFDADRNQYVMKFRYGISVNNTNIDFAKEVLFDLCKKKLILKIYDVVNEEAKNLYTILEKPNTITLTTYDGQGEPIYSYFFLHLKLENDIFSFNIADDKIAIRKFVFSFKEVVKHGINP